MPRPRLNWPARRPTTPQCHLVERSSNNPTPLSARLEQFVNDTGKRAVPLAVPGFAVVMALGVAQVAATVLHSAIESP
jgi:hypothetical protein